MIFFLYEITVGGGGGNETDCGGAGGVICEDSEFVAAPTSPESSSGCNAVLSNCNAFVVAATRSELETLNIIN